LIFIPNVVIDGMLMNAEYYLSDFGTFFNSDGLIMCAFDCVLWIKLCLRLLLRQYSANGRPPYQIPQFIYAVLIFFYSVWMVFLYICVHQRYITTTGMSISNHSDMLILLINALTHTYVCSYTSMMSPGIIMLDKALRGSDARVKQLKIFIRYLRVSPLPIIITLGFFAYTSYVYASILTISLQTSIGFNENEEIKGLIYTICILNDIWTCFFIVNLAYGFFKRMGGYLGIRPICGIPFPDCTSYSQQINAILSQCTANFRLDTRGQIVGVTVGARR